MSDHTHTHDFGPSQFLYYALGEVLLHIEHDSGWLSESDKPLTTRMVYSLLVQREFLPSYLNNVELQLDRVGISFDGSETARNQSLFSLRATDPDKLNVARTITELNRQIQERKGEDKGIRLDVDGKVAVLRQALPNWYSGASPHIGLGSHGPGRKPRPVRNSDNPHLKQFQFMPVFNNKVNTFSAALSNVDVFILDTIPKVSRLESALVDYPLLNRYAPILAKSGAGNGTYSTPKAEYIYAPAMGQDFAQTNDPHDPGHYHPIIMEGHNYDSSDHGLFIAGIVHDIAPEAQLYVIEILNNMGIGTFWNIAAGFREVLNIRRNRPGNKAIINCSLTLSFPTEGHYGNTPDFTDVGLYEFVHLAMNGANVVDSRPLGILVNKINCDQLNDLRATIKHLVDGTTELFKEMIENFHTGALIISAAGNDSDRDHGDTRPARYLAKTKQSTGVGALKKDGKVASYSNQDDDPAPDGFYAFGGDYSDAGSTVDGEGRTVYADVGQGVIGIFLAPFEGSCNLNGYAEWAGTSFAAPVLSGTIAKACLATSLSPQAAKEQVVRAVSPVIPAENASGFTVVDQR